MRCSVLSLRRCYLLDHHIGAECTSSWRHLIQPSNPNSTSHKLQTDAARIDKIKSMLYVFLALISLAEMSACGAQFYHWDVVTYWIIILGLSAQAADDISYSLQTQIQQATSCRQMLQGLTKSSPCCVSFWPWSVWQDVSMRCSVLSLRRCYLLDHHIGAECTSSCRHLIQPSNSNSTSHKLQTDAARIDKNQVHAVCLFGPNQSGKMSACGAQFYHWDVVTYWIIILGLSAQAAVDISYSLQTQIQQATSCRQMLLGLTKSSPCSVSFWPWSVWQMSACGAQFYHWDVVTYWIIILGLSAQAAVDISYSLQTQIQQATSCRQMLLGLTKSSPCSVSFWP